MNRVLQMERRGLSSGGVGKTRGKKDSEKTNGQFTGFVGSRKDDTNTVAIFGSEDMSGAAAAPLVWLQP